MHFSCPLCRISIGEEAEKNRKRANTYILANSLTVEEKEEIEVKMMKDLRNILT